MLAFEALAQGALIFETPMLVGEALLSGTLAQAQKAIPFGMPTVDLWTILSETLTQPFQTITVA